MNPLYFSYFCIPFREADVGLGPILQENPRVKIEAGKYFRTRNGRKAYVASTSPFKCTSSNSVWIGWVEDSSGTAKLFGWSVEGNHFVEEVDAESGFDLVEEWRELFKGEFWGYEIGWDYGPGLWVDEGRARLAASSRYPTPKVRKFRVEEVV